MSWKTRILFFVGHYKFPALQAFHERLRVVLLQSGISESAWHGMTANEFHPYWVISNFHTTIFISYLRHIINISLTWKICWWWRRRCVHSALCSTLVRQIVELAWRSPTPGCVIVIHHGLWAFRGKYKAVDHGYHARCYHWLPNDENRKYAKHQLGELRAVKLYKKNQEKLP